MSIPNLDNVKGWMTSSTPERAAEVASILSKKMNAHIWSENIWILSNDFTFPELKKALGTWNKADDYFWAQQTT